MDYQEIKGLKEAKMVRTIRRSLIGFVLFVLLMASFGTVDTGKVGVATRFGKVVYSRDPGLYLQVPIIDRMNSIDVKTRTIKKDQMAAASKDLQDVYIFAMVNYRIDKTKAVNIYSEFKSTENFEDDVIEPMIREVIKSISAEYTAEELVTKRAEYSDKVNKNLTDRMGQRYALLERVNITNFQFSKSFTEAIEAKVTATQNAEAARNKLAQVEFEAEQRIATAKAEAESIRIQAQAIQNQGGREYVSLKAIEKWDGKLPVQMIPGSTVPFININK